MEHLHLAFHAAAALTGFLSCFILLFVNKEQPHANRLLAFVIFSLAMTNLNLYLFYSKLILSIPWYYKLSYPINFLVGPALLIYVRSVIMGELTFKKYDLFFLLPAILNAADMFPFFIMDNKQKIELLNLYMASPKDRYVPDKEGIISPLIVNLIRIAWSLVLSGLSLRMVLRFKSQGDKTTVQINKKLLNWLSTLTIMLTAMFVILMLMYIILSLYGTTLIYTEYIYAVLVLAIIIQLYFRPAILYGIYKPVSADQTVPTSSNALDNSYNISKNHDNIAIPYSPKTNEAEYTQIQYKTKLESYLENQKPFLRKGYTLEKMAKEINISRNTLSAFINREYGTGFNELMNRYRVQFIISNFQTSDWKNLSLEGIASEAGFGSRTAFYNAFKKVTGFPPSEYLMQSSATKA